tara:strand:- start:1024 stop:1308 length:285 start_codon:yes stop_codon:yes gene_type:complete
MTTIGIILDAGSTPAISTIIKDFEMFNWFTKRKNNLKKDTINDDDYHINLQDEIEESLWEIKDQYDLNTEEIEKVVIDKRQNIDYMNECLKNKK